MEGSNFTYIEIFTAGNRVPRSYDFEAKGKYSEETGTVSINSFRSKWINFDGWIYLNNLPVTD